MACALLCTALLAEASRRNAGTIMMWQTMLGRMVPKTEQKMFHGARDWQRVCRLGMSMSPSAQEGPPQRTGYKSTDPLTLGASLLWWAGHMSISPTIQHVQCGLSREVGGLRTYTSIVLLVVLKRVWRGMLVTISYAAELVSVHMKQAVTVLSQSLSDVVTAQ